MPKTDKTVKSTAFHSSRFIIINHDNLYHKNKRLKRQADQNAGLAILKHRYFVRQMENVPKRHSRNEKSNARYGRFCNQRRNVKEKKVNAGEAGKNPQKFPDYFTKIELASGY